MNYNFHTVLIIMVIHYLGDFVLQTHEQSQRKSSENKWLFYHTGSYSLIWLLAAWGLYTSIWAALLFASVTFVAHTATDWVTSRVGKYFWSSSDYHNGFAVVGFDQILHYVQLLLTHSLVISTFDS
jgi:hypothetical protein